jgi:hypothetical protein
MRVWGIYRSGNENRRAFGCVHFPAKHKSHAFSDRVGHFSPRDICPEQRVRWGVSRQNKHKTSGDAWHAHDSTCSRNMCWSDRNMIGVWTAQQHGKNTQKTKADYKQGGVLVIPDRYFDIKPSDGLYHSSLSLLSLSNRTYDLSVTRFSIRSSKLQTGARIMDLTPCSPTDRVTSWVRRLVTGGHSS